MTPRSALRLARLRRAARLDSFRTNHHRKQDGDVARPNDRYCANETAGVDVNRTLEIATLGLAVGARSSASAFLSSRDTSSGHPCGQKITARSAFLR